MGTCSSQKQIGDYQSEIQKKHRQLEKIDLDIEKLDQLQDKQTSKGLGRQAKLTEEKKNKLYAQQKRLQQFLIEHEKNQDRINKADFEQQQAQDNRMTRQVVLDINQKENQELERANQLNEEIQRLKDEKRALKDEMQADQSEEEVDSELEEYKKQNQERLRKLEENDYQNKDKKIETENKNVPELLYPDIQKEKFIPVKQIQDYNQYQSIQQQYQSQGALK